MEVKRQVLYSVLLGRDHHDRRPRSPEDGTHKTSFIPSKTRFKIRFVLKNKVRDKVELSKNKVRDKVEEGRKQSRSKVEAK